MNQRVTILGREYLIKHVDYTEEVFYDGFVGFCSATMPIITVCRLSTHPEYKDEPADDLVLLEKRILRHEIVHAYLGECGLSANTCSCSAWAENEEMVDWIAYQGAKIVKTWEEAGAL